MRHDVGVDERELDRLAGLDRERSDGEAQVLAGLDRDRAGRRGSAPRQGLGDGLMRRATRSARIGWAAIVFGDGPVAGEPGERRRQLVDRGEQVDRLAGVGAQVQVKLVDGLEVGDLEEERPAVGQDVGRADRQRVVAGLPGWRGENSGEP